MFLKETCQLKNIYKFSIKPLALGSSVLNFFFAVVKWYGYTFFKSRDQKPDVGAGANNEEENGRKW